MAFGTRNGQTEQEQTSEDKIEEEGRPWWSGNRPEFMLEFRFVGGDRAVYSYGDFRGAKLDDVLVLYFDTATITIKGKSLALLLSDLRRHHVVYVRQQHVDSMFERSRVQGGYIDTIEIKEPDLEALGKG
jgi:hypothetical protein